MNTRKIALALVVSLLMGLVLSGCGSGGEVEVDQKALNSRNAQRQGAPGGGAPPASTAGAPAPGP